MRFPTDTPARLIKPVRDDLERTRSDVLMGIASTEIGQQILREIIRSASFVPVGNPAVIMRMYRGPDGLYLGTAKAANGKILGNARWKPVMGVGSRLLTSAGMLTGHLMLVEISAKIDSVQKDVRSIRRALDDDRMQELKASIRGVHAAIEARSSENKNALLNATIPDLQKAISKCIAALRSEISEIPEPKEWKG